MQLIFYLLVLAFVMFVLVYDAGCVARNTQYEVHHETEPVPEQST